MPAKIKEYKHVIFTPAVIKKAIDTLLEALPEDTRIKYIKYGKNIPGSKIIKLPSGETWQHDTDDEFFADYVKGFVSASLDASYSGEHFPEGTMELSADKDKTKVRVSMDKRDDIEKVFNVFEENVDKCRVPEKPSVEKVFIGHGKNTQWRELKDHLHDKHQIDVEAYEIGARAGHTVKEILESMLSSSTVALLVFTGEDLDIKGGLHARENVIHELGLFQGRLGWQKAVVLLEEGVSEFSNILGVEQIRFRKGDIKETFGDILATIKREFPHLK